MLIKHVIYDRCGIKKVSHSWCRSLISCNWTTPRLRLSSGDSKQEDISLTKNLLLAAVTGSIYTNYNRLRDAHIPLLSPTNKINLMRKRLRTPILLKLRILKKYPRKSQMSPRDPPRLCWFSKSCSLNDFSSIILYKLFMDGNRLFC